jgi:hypothetical protein
MHDPFEELTRDDFLQALDPSNWQETTTLHTPGFATRLDAEDRLLIAIDTTQLELAPQDVQALTRFLTKYVTLAPIEPPGDLSDFTPTRMDTQEGEEPHGYHTLSEW